MKLYLSRDGLYESAPGALTPQRSRLGREALAKFLRKDSELAKILKIIPTGGPEEAPDIPPATDR